MMNKFEKKAMLLNVLGDVVSRIEADKKYLMQKYMNIGTEDEPNWEWVEVTVDALSEDEQCKIEQMDAVIKHLEKLI